MSVLSMPNMSNDLLKVSTENRGMKESTKTKFKAGYAMRLKMARQDAGYTQKEFAKLLDIPPDTYSKYERRSELPPSLLVAVCNITGHDPWFFLTGKPSFSPPQTKEPPEMDMYTRVPPKGTENELQNIDMEKLLQALDQFEKESNEFDKETINKAKDGIRTYFHELETEERKAANGSNRN